MRLDGLQGRRVAIWGFGREGRAALQAVRQACPGQTLTVLCSEGERAEVNALGFDHLEVDTATVDANALKRFDVVIKSPGISPYQPAALAAAEAGVNLISGSQLWFAAHRQDRTVCVTATKGKSTTTSLIAHLLRSLGVRTGLVGNIGLPLLELLQPEAPPELWVIELSSFQTRDAEARPALAVINNVLEEHLDWHGSVARYREDKLALLQGAGAVLLNATDPVLRARFADGLGDQAATQTLLWYNQADSWHVESGWLCRGPERVFPTSELPLPGLHNAENACAALAAVEYLGYDARQAAPALREFRPLPHRLQPLGVRDGIRYVNDSIATTPAAALAAFAYARQNDAAVVQIVGGHDRGLDWREFLTAMQATPAAGLIFTGAVGQRVFGSLSASERTRLRAQFAADFDAAFQLAQATLRALGPEAINPTLLLSPGAPSFGQFKDYVARGRRFAALAGFDGEAIAGIAGLGIA